MASSVTVNGIKPRQASGKTGRKGLCLLLGLLWSCALLPSGSVLAQAVPLDRIIAIADEGVILKSEFDTRWEQVKQQLATNPNPMTMPPEAVLKRQLLDQLVIESLQMQNAERVGIRIDDNQLNQAMTEIAGQSGYNFQDFTNLLQAQGIYQETREALRKEIIINNYENSAVNRRISVSRQEVENYLRSEAGISTVAPEYHVAHILIPASSNSSDAQRAELASLLHRELENGADIVQMTASRQISGISVSGGDLGWNKPENLPSLFRDFVPSMQSGEVRPPFTSESGHHIVKLLEIRGGAVLNVEQFKVRHILITPNIVRTEEQAEELIHELHARIQAGEDFADIARQNTNDSGSMASGGDLGWIEDGMLPPDFLAKVRETPIGTISAPFRASTGWHVVEVSERRMQDITEDNKRFQAQRILRDRKFENERQNWLTELRDTSHIEIFDF